MMKAETRILMRRVGSQLVRYTAHVVHPGDSLKGIALLYGTDWRAVVRLTYQVLGTHPDYIVPGMLILVREEAIDG